MQIVVSASDLIIFDEVSHLTTQVGTLEDTLTFRESIFSNFVFQNILDTFTFSDATQPTSVRHYALSEQIVFSESVWPRTIFCNTSDFLFLSDVLDSTRSVEIQESLIFSDLAVSVLAKLATPDELDFSDSVFQNHFSRRSIVETIVLTDWTRAAVINPTILDLPVGVAPPIANPTVFLADAGETLVMDNPVFGDSDGVNYQRLNKTTRGYTPIIEAPANRPPVKTKKMSFDYVKGGDQTRLRNFVIRNTGRPVTLTDMYGTVYTVILQNPELEYAQPGRNNRTHSLDFYVL